MDAEDEMEYNAVRKSGIMVFCSTVESSQNSIAEQANDSFHGNSNPGKNLFIYSSFASTLNTQSISYKDVVGGIL